MYTDGTTRRYGVREKEHHHDVRSWEEVKFTWTKKEDSVSEVHPSAITDHITKNNHTVDWEEVAYPQKTMGDHCHHEATDSGPRHEP